MEKYCLGENSRFGVGSAKFYRQLNFVVRGRGTSFFQFLTFLREAFINDATLLRGVEAKVG